jgi:hypothetical protein
MNSCDFFQVYFLLKSPICDATKNITEQKKKTTASGYNKVFYFYAFET